MTSALVHVIHPVTGGVMRLHPAFAGSDSDWLPANATDLDDETTAQLRDQLTARAFTSSFTQESQPHEQPA